MNLVTKGIVAGSFLLAATSGGYVLGVRDALQVSNRITQTRLMKLELRAHHDEARLDALDNTNEVFVNSVANVNRRLNVLDANQEVLWELRKMVWHLQKR